MRHSPGRIVPGWLVLLVLLAMGACSALPAGHRFGWPGYAIGFAAGVLLPPLLTIGLLLLAEFVRRAGPRLPPCHSGTCVGRRWPSLSERDLGDYVHDSADGESVLRCKCGRLYVTREAGERFLERLPDGTLKPYMVRRSFRGWVPDTGPAPDAGLGDR